MMAFKGKYRDGIKQGYRKTKHLLYSLHLNGNEVATLWTLNSISVTVSLPFPIYSVHALTRPTPPQSPSRNHFGATTFTGIFFWFLRSLGNLIHTERIVSPKESKRQAWSEGRPKQWSLFICRRAERFFSPPPPSSHSIHPLKEGHDNVWGVRGTAREIFSI